MKAGTETLVGLQDDCYRQNTVQQYFWFGGDFPTRVDLSPIWKAAKKVAPNTAEIWGGFDGRVAFPAGRTETGLIIKPDWRCCSAGTVSVAFHLESGHVVVTRAHLNSEREFKWTGCR